MENYRFCYQENQYFGEVQPCTPAVFNRTVDSEDVARKIQTRRSVDELIRKGESLDKWLNDYYFRKFCAKQAEKQGREVQEAYTRAEAAAMDELAEAVVAVLHLCRACLRWCAP